MAIALIQSRVIQSAGNNPAFSSGCTAGSLVVAVMTIRGSSNFITAAPSGFAEILASGVDNQTRPGTGDHGRTQMFYRAGVGGQTSLGAFTFSGSQTTVWMLLEFSGWDGNAPTSTGSKNEQTFSAGHITLNAMSATAGSPAVGIGAFSVASNSQGQTADSGYTAVGGTGVDVGGNFGPNLNVVYKIDASAPSTYTPGSNDGGEEWCGMGAVFKGLAASGAAAQAVIV